MDLSSSIEAVLFWKGEPMSVKRLSSALEKTDEEIRLGLAELEKKLENRGVQLIFKSARPDSHADGDDEVMLGTHSQTSTTIEKLTKEELMKDLGRAGLETLSIILYRGPVSRKDIDYIRGVNSNFILRNLLIRGLIERIPNPTDQRSFQYKPTFELLGYLGIARIEDLPEFAETKKEIEDQEKAIHDSEPESMLEQNV
jgi:segregation and condensation protein B